MHRTRVALIASLLLAFSFPALAETLSGRVVHVADGDTITILDAGNHQHKIRLSGIDAPERKQANGKASGNHLADLVAGKAVSVEWSKHDKYQRIVGKVLQNGQDVCLEQIKAGMAWHYKKYEKESRPRTVQYMLLLRMKPAPLAADYGRMLTLCHRGSGDIWESRAGMFPSFATVKGEKR